jgi:hypothetical protein
MMYSSEQMALLILQEMERLRDEMEGFRQQLQLQRKPEPPQPPEREDTRWPDEPAPGPWDL